MAALLTSCLLIACWLFIIKLRVFNLQSEPMGLGLSVRDRMEESENIERQTNTLLVLVLSWDVYNFKKI